MPEPVRGPEAVLTMLREGAGIHPPSRIEGGHSFGQADWVCVENVKSSARKDSPKSYRIRTCDTFRIAEEGLSEIRFDYDALDLMTQIGMSLNGD